ncbi:hypothetical protein CSE45_1491 [Citreicella sp. SE45]|nr:hypothetical protein CSE45_1491 [Citreicella sp. SE45]
MPVPSVPAAEIETATPARKHRLPAPDQQPPTRSPSPHRTPSIRTPPKPRRSTAR